MKDRKIRGIYNTIFFLYELCFIRASTSTTLHKKDILKKNALKQKKIIITIFIKYGDL